MGNDYSSRDNLIDILKFVASIFIVGIHTGICSDSTSVAWQFDSLLRLAVPFFIMCSGYYLGEKCEIHKRKIEDSAHNRNVFLYFVKKIGILYVVWSIIYLFISIPEWIETGWFSAWAFVDWGIALLIKGSYYHLWYLLFLIYAVAILFFITKKITVKVFPVLILPLYLIEVIQYGYRWVMPEVIQDFLIVFDKIPCLSAVTRVLPFLMLGMYVSQEKKKEHTNLIGFITISFIILVVERNFLLNNGQLNVSYIVGTLLVSYFLFQFIIHKKNIIQKRNFKVMSQIGMNIYMVHPIFIRVLQYFDITRKGCSFIIVLLASYIWGVIILKIVKLLEKIHR